MSSKWKLFFNHLLPVLCAFGIVIAGAWVTAAYSEDLPLPLQNHKYQDTFPISLTRRQLGDRTHRITGRAGKDVVALTTIKTKKAELTFGVIGNDVVVTVRRLNRRRQ